MSNEHIDESNLDKLAYQFSTTNNIEELKRIVSQALSDPALDQYIKKHTKGWHGVSGNFSKHMSKVIETLKLYSIEQTYKSA